MSLLQLGLNESEPDPNKSKSGEANEGESGGVDISALSKVPTYSEFVPSMHSNIALNELARSGGWTVDWPSTGQVHCELTTHEPVVQHKKTAGSPGEEPAAFRFDQNRDWFRPGFRIPSVVPDFARHWRPGHP